MFLVRFQKAWVWVEYVSLIIRGSRQLPSMAVTKGLLSQLWRLSPMIPVAVPVWQGLLEAHYWVATFKFLGSPPGGTERNGQELHAVGRGGSKVSWGLMGPRSQRTFIIVPSPLTWNHVHLSQYAIHTHTHTCMYTCMQTCTYIWVFISHVALFHLGSLCLKS